MLFHSNSTKQVYVKRFKTTGMDYTVPFTNTLADFELSEYHNRLHEVFERLLQAITQGIQEHNQVCIVMRSPQLKNPISLPFMFLPQLTTERILSHVERVLQSNEDI